MPYQEESIKVITDRLNTQYFLPSIQRKFVWKPEKVILLFDSIMRGYPISSFLFWELTKENRDKWEVYKFCDKAFSTGTQHIKHPSAVGIQNLGLVLDGQQRLTSLLLGLKGVFCIRRLRQRRIPEYYPKCRLYLDLFKEPAPADDENEFTGKPYYAFKWLEEPPENDSNQKWFLVGQILDCHNDNEFYKLKETEQKSFPANVTEAQKNTYERNLWRLYQAIWKDPAISFYVEREQDYDRVLDIFVRANEAGTELTKAEIISSMLESKWKIGAKDEVENLLNEVNNHLLRRNKINLEFVMRACLALADLPVRYRINTFTNKNIDFIEGLWPNIRDAIVRTLTLVNRFGIDRNNLTGLNVLIPLVSYIYRNPGIKFLGTTPYETRNAGLMRRWLILAMLNKVFGRGADQVLANLRHVIQAFPQGSDFPVNELNNELSRMHFASELNDNEIRDYLDSEYPVEFLHLTLLYDDHFWDAVDTEQDHIFPKSLFELSNPEFAALPKEKQITFKKLCNKAANIQPLMDEENNKKRAKSFEEWLGTRDESFRRIHLIPADNALLKFQRFDDFVAAREALIINRLKNILC